MEDDESAECECALRREVVVRKGGYPEEDEEERESNGRPGDGEESLLEFLCSSGVWRLGNEVVRDAGAADADAAARAAIGGVT